MFTSSTLPQANMTLSPSPSHSTSSILNVEEENAALKRKIDDLEKQIEELTTRRKHTSSPIKLLGRAVCRLASCYETASVLTKEADRRALADEEGTLEDTPITDEEVDIARAQDRRFSAYRKLIEIVPRIAELLKMPDEEKKLADYLEKLESGVNSSRTDDNSRMKWEVAEWLNDAFHPQVRLSSKSRTNWGLQHDVCRRLLTPIEVDWDDLDIREAIRSGTSDFNINESYFLCCFYPDGGIDPNNVEHNFLRSRWLLLAFHAIFISPSVDEDEYVETSDDESPHKKQKRSAHSEASKSNVACRIGMNGRVTGRVIAYTAVMFWFSLFSILTDASRWTETHNGFSFHGLYNFIVDYFEDTPNPTSKDNARSSYDGGIIFPTHYLAASDSRASYKKLAAHREASQRN
ncbi:hypothetical protein NP233_g12698 [Leucocoprinus birnbaumii]|uniref:Uncharacterized protein n=1 Tax=Leucocoprinus birnbaumii TaxID=56174 RepID=A0AAD5VE95_9AGAR|nr:hypothetical protein NP233_g12698 [Leucocoprinus birnbaumii]